MGRADDDPETPGGNYGPLRDDLKRAYRRGGLAWCTAQDLAGFLGRIDIGVSAATESDLAYARRAYKEAVEALTDTPDSRWDGDTIGSTHALGARAVRIFLLQEQRPPPKKVVRESLGNPDTVRRAERTILDQVAMKLAAQVPTRQTTREALLQVHSRVVPISTSARAFLASFSALQRHATKGELLSAKPIANSLFYSIELRVRSSRLLEVTGQHDRMPKEVETLRDCLTMLRLAKFWDSGGSFERLLSVARTSNSLSGPHILFERAHYEDTYAALRYWELLLTAPFEADSGLVFVPGYGAAPSVPTNLDYFQLLATRINKATSRALSVLRELAHPPEIDSSIFD